MTDEGKQAEIAENEQGAEIEPNQQQAGEESATLESVQAELEETRKALKSANRESAQRRLKLEELEKAEADRQEAELSEMEKLQKKLSDQQAELERVQREARQERVKAAVIAEANKLDFQDPEDAYRLIDLSTVEVEGDGKVEGVTELLKALAEQKPYMIKKAKAVIKGAITNPGENVSSTGETEAQQRARVYGASDPTLFTPEAVKRRGGGVYISEQ